MTVKELIDSARVRNVDWYRKAIIPKIVNAKSIYKSVEAQTGVPAGFIAAVHVRENGPDVGKFLTYLGNGQSLKKVTTIVPKGRGPFNSWADGAVDAIKLQKLDKIKKWTIERAVIEWEKYNGLGYKNRGKLSPYVWTGTQHGVGTGYYTSDGKYSSTAVDKGIGTFALYSLLINADSDFKILNNVDYSPPKAPGVNIIQRFISWIKNIFSHKA